MLAKVSRSTPDLELNVRMCLLKEQYVYLRGDSEGTMSVDTGRGGGMRMNEEKSHVGKDAEMICHSDRICSLTGQ